MISFSWVKFCVVNNFSHNWISETELSLYFGLFRKSKLGRVLRNNDRSVLSSRVHTLAIQCCWIMCVPEKFYDLNVRDHWWVECNPYDLGVTCLAAADFSIIWVGIFTCSVAADNRFDPRSTTVHSFDAPEAPAANYSIFFTYKVFTLLCILLWPLISLWTLFHWAFSVHLFLFQNILAFYCDFLLLEALTFRCFWSLNWFVSDTRKPNEWYNNEQSNNIVTNVKIFARLLVLGF